MYLRDIYGAVPKRHTDVTKKQTQILPTCIKLVIFTSVKRSQHEKCHSTLSQWPRLPPKLLFSLDLVYSRSCSWNRLQRDNCISIGINRRLLHLKSLTKSPHQMRLLRSFMIGQARNSICCHSGMKIIWPLICSVLSMSWKIISSPEQLFQIHKDI